MHVKQENKRETRSKYLNFFSMAVKCQAEYLILFFKSIVSSLPNIINGCSFHSFSSRNGRGREGNLGSTFHLL